VINPFDFFVDANAEKFPFVYSSENARELAPYLELDPQTPLLAHQLLQKSGFADENLLRQAQRHQAGLVRG